MANPTMFTPMMAEQAASGGLLNKLMQKAIAAWPTIAPILKSVGISLAEAVAAMYLVPDHAVMTKDEVEKGEELSASELMIRKAAIPIIVSNLAGAPTKITNIGWLVAAPGVESKVRAFAQVLKGAPGFFITYKALSKRIEDKYPTLNIRELTPESKSGATALVAANRSGQFLTGVIEGVRRAGGFN